MKTSKYNLALKYLLTIFILSLYLSSCASQKPLSEARQKEFDSLLEAGKKAFYDKNYSNAIETLKKAAVIKDDDQEVHYFLGYAFERFSSNDGSSMLENKRTYIKKASDHFRKVIEINPEYKGESVVLDPYSKLTSLWGSLAIAYITKGKADSARWAFQQGYNTGGFFPSVMEYNRDIMATCDSNAILFTNGDNDTFPMWYLQYIERYRTDITVINLSLLNTSWYTKQLKNAYPFGSNNLYLSLQDSYIDSLRSLIFPEKYIQLAVPDDSLVPAGYMQWLVKPTINNKYVRIQDLLVLKILTDNSWHRPVYFSTTVANINLLGLDDFLQMEGLAMRLVPYEGHTVSAEKISANLFTTYRYEHIGDEYNTYVPGMLGLYGNYRIALYVLAREYLRNSEKDKARDALDLMNKKMPPDVIPVVNAQLDKLLKQLDDVLKL